MNKSKESKLKGLAIYSRRLQDLLDDGYHVIISYDDDRLIMNKLRHHNGNRIVLKLTFEDGIISQLTNHVQVYHQKVY